MAEASAGLDGWPEHFRRAVDAAPDAAAAAEAARALAPRAEPRAAFRGGGRGARSRVVGARRASEQLALAARGGSRGRRDERAAHGAHRRRSVARRYASGRSSDPAMPPELLAVAAFISVLMNEPADGGRRARDPGAAGRRDAGRTAARLVACPSGALADLGGAVRAGAAAARHVDPEARATGDSGRLAVGLATRGWLALRRGDLSAAEADTRTALAATELPAPPMYRVLNGGVLVDALVEQGELDEAEEALAALDAEAESGSLTAAVLRLARGRLRVEQGRIAEGLDDFLGVGARLTRAMVTSPGYIPWRSEAALAQLALGDREHGGASRRGGARARAEPSAYRARSASSAGRRRRGRRRSRRAPAP